MLDVRTACLPVALALLAACGQSRSGNLRTIGGTVDGLVGSGLVLQVNGGNDLAVPSSATTFRFSAFFPEGSIYSVTVASQPSGPVQSCIVSNGTGTTGGADVDHVTVTCVTTNLCLNVTCPAATDRCHVAGVCDPATVQCSAQTLVQCPSAQACDAADGLCKAALLCATVVCPPAADLCHAQGTCDPATGVCLAPTPIQCPSGQSCDPSSGGCFVPCGAPTPDRCGGQCVDLQTSTQHCQACGHACTFANASATCQQGACVMGTCSSGYGDCVNGPADGCETYLLGSDGDHCGTCGNRCLVGQACSSGSCAESTVTCSSPGASCAQPGCFDPGRWAVTPGVAVDLQDGRRLWTRLSLGPSSHFQAQTSCQGLALEGITGWRLPTYAELAKTLFKAGGLQGCPVCNPSVDQSVFPGTLNTGDGGFYWTTDLDPSGGWETVFYCDGRKNYPAAGGTLLQYRCTRDPLP